MIETRQIALHCSICRNQKSFSLNMSQVRRLAEGRGIQMHCTYCAVSQIWQIGRAHV